MLGAREMADLTDDAWGRVFAWLPLRERIRAEAVCKRWAALMPYADLTHLDLAALPFRPDRTTSLQYQDGELLITQRTVLSYWLRRVLSEVLDRSGPFLHSASFTTAEHRLCLGPPCLNLLAAAAGPTLARLNLSNCLLKRDCLALLAHFPHLRYLSLASTVFLEDAESAVVADPRPLRDQLQAIVADHAHLAHLNLLNLPFTPRLANQRLTRLQLSRLALDDIALQRLVVRFHSLLSTPFPSL